MPDSPADPVRASLGRQTFMTLLGARAATVAPGRVVIELPARPDLCQQNGFLHAGAITSIADSACGYAALTLMPAGQRRPQRGVQGQPAGARPGDLFRAEATVVRPGRTLTVCQAEVVAVTEGGPDVPVALMQATMIAVVPRG